MNRSRSFVPHCRAGGASGARHRGWRAPRRTAAGCSTTCSIAASRSRSSPAARRRTEDSELSARIDRLESALRQLTGTIEQLQYQQPAAREAAPAAAAPGSGNPVPPPRRAPATAADIGAPAMGSPPASPPPAPGAAPTCSIPRTTPMRQACRARSAGHAVAPAPPPGAIVSAEPVGRRARRPRRRRAARSVDAAVAAPAPARAGCGAACRRRRRATSVPTGVELATLPPSARPKDDYDLGLRLCAAQGLRAGDASLPRFPEEISRRARWRRRAISGWARACSSASATATPPRPSSLSRPNTSTPARRRRRCCGSASRSPR